MGAPSDREATRRRIEAVFRPGHLSARVGGSSRDWLLRCFRWGGRCWLEVGLKGGDHQFDALVEVGGSVVAGEFGGYGAYPGEVAAGEAVQAEPEQVVGLVGVVDEFL